MWIYVVIGIVILLISVLYIMTDYYFRVGMLSKPSEKSMEVLSEFSNYKDAPGKKAVGAGLRYIKAAVHEDIYIKSFDGLKLHGRLFPAPEPEKNRLLIAVHGCRTYPNYEFAPYIRFYHSLGFNFLMVDDRGHGESEGKYIGFGNLDRLDVIKWTEYAAQRFGQDCEILLHGISMGAAAVTSACGEELPPQVMGAVADCGFTSVYEQFTHCYKKLFSMPAIPFVPLISLLCKIRAGYDFYSDSPLKLVKKARVPILFVQGTADMMVLPEMAYRLYEACASRKKLFIVEGAGHAQSMGLDPRGYKSTIREFFGI